MATTGKELMLRFQRGDESAFEEIVLRYQRAVLNFAYRAIGDSARAEDIAQEAFLRIFRARRRYRPTASFTTWLFTIVNRLCMNEIRSRRREARALRDPWKRAGSAAGETVIPRCGDRGDDPPPEIAERWERARMVRAAIQSLPSSQRAAVLLRRYEGMSYQEVAEAMGLTVMAVKSLLVRARENLRKRLDPYLRGGGRRPAATRGTSEMP